MWRVLCGSYPSILPCYEWYISCSKKSGNFLNAINPMVFKQHSSIPASLRTSKVLQERGKVQCYLRIHTDRHLGRVSSSEQPRDHHFYSCDADHGLLSPQMHFHDDWRLASHRALVDVPIDPSNTRIYEAWSGKCRVFGETSSSLGFGKMLWRRAAALLWQSPVRAWRREKCVRAL